MKTITYQPKYADKPATLGVELFEYTNGGTCIDLIDMKDGETFMCATVWIEGLKDNEVAIKNDRENQGILEVLADAEIISWPKRIAKAGQTTVYICVILPD